MKIAVVLLVLMPLALSTEVDKRGLLEFLGFGHLLSLQDLKETAQNILDKVGSDATEQSCESACHTVLIVDQSHLIHSICSPLCRSFQTIVNLLHLTPGLGR
ncbi:uncharacterized protein LOC143282648 [Babylonia areolata]|uniref:uncharacterized protein LOC143282648 n=1 Tax=Babylonia areolata TaxID=304850 RepID=UPI003FD2B4D3